MEEEKLTARFECSEGAETILCESLLFLVSLKGARPNPARLQGLSQPDQREREDRLSLSPRESPHCHRRQQAVTECDPDLSRSHADLPRAGPHPPL